MKDSGSSPLSVTNQMQYTEYTKVVAPFFKELLERINKINIFSWANKDFPMPNETIHYQPYKTGINIFTSPVIKLSHELSHMLEVKDNNRLLKFDYGIRKYFPTTHEGQLQAVAREARARGIQTKLVEIAFGNTTLLVHRGAWLYIKPFDKRVARFNNGSEVCEWSASITQSAYNDWSKERIVETWKQKAEFINHWLETSGQDPIDSAAHLNRYKANDEWFSTAR